MYNVLRTFSRLQAALEGLDPTRSIPDHNLLSWELLLSGNYTECGNEDIDVANQDTVEDGNSLSSQSKPAVTKFKLNDIPHDFMSDPDSVSMIDEQIHRITAMQDVEAALDDAYSNFCDTLKECMTRDLPHHTIVHTTEVNNKKRRTNKVWWTDELTTLRMVKCDSERQWRQAESVDKPATTTVER